MLTLAATLGVQARGLAEQSATSPLTVDAELTLCVASYNLAVSAWEPVLEPRVDPDTQRPVPWGMRALASLSV